MLRGMFEERMKAAKAIAGLFYDKYEGYGSAD